MSKMISKKYLNIFISNIKIMHISFIIYKYNFTLRSHQKRMLATKAGNGHETKNMGQRWMFANLFIFGKLVQNFHFGWGGATITTRVYNFILHLVRNFHHQSFHLMVWTPHPNVIEPCNWSHQNPFLHGVVDKNMFPILV